MDETEFLTEEFERHRGHLRAVAYRMLGSVSEADDALQDAWLRVSRADTSEVDNMGGWLTTVVARTCLNHLRARKQRRETPYEVLVPDPIVDLDEKIDPEHQAVLADSVGLALLVVLEQLNPAERLAFVLHDLFGVPFDEIGQMLDRTPTAARQLASRARRRVRGVPTPDRDRASQRAVVDAFFAAADRGDFDGLVEVLHPDVVLRSDGGTARPQMTMELHGPAAVAQQAFASTKMGPFVHRAWVNGAAGVVVAPHGRPQFVMAFTVTDGRIAAIDVLSDPDRLARLNLELGG